MISQCRLYVHVARFSYELVIRLPSNLIWTLCHWKQSEPLNF